MRTTQEEILGEHSPEEILAIIARFAAEMAASDWPFARTAPGRSHGLQHRLCHLSLQGGGMHGAAHVGFIAGMEAAGVRFAGVAGASAGAIVATALVCARGSSIYNSVSEPLLELMNKVPGETFIDGPGPIRSVIKQALRSARGLKLRHWPGLWQAYQRLMRLRGLNPGIAFEVWMEDLLRQHFDVATVKDLDKILAHQFRDILVAVKPDQAKSADRFSDKQGEDLASITENRFSGYVLKLMASAVPVGLKCQFPEDLWAFRLERDQISPAHLVRASMAIPFFFQPLEMPTHKALWAEYIDRSLAGLMVDDDLYSARELEKIYFVDGGVFSNLPLYAFEGFRDGLPTLGISLIFSSGADLWPRNPKRPSRFIADTVGVLAAMHKQRDRDAFISLNRAVAYGASQRVFLASVDTGDVSWLDFMMSPSDIAHLYHRGLAASLSFLRNSLS